MNWGIEDLAAASALLLGAAIALTVVFKTVPRRLPRNLLAGGVVLLLIGIWVQLAVGIF